MKQKGKRKPQWKNQRHGFRHELILTLTDNDFSWRDAEKIVDAIFKSIKERLKNKEDVSVDGFGTWTIVKPTHRRSWKFGQVVKLKTRPVFHEQQGVLLGPFTFKWKPHPTWKATRDRPLDRRSNKYKADVARKEQEGHYRLLDSYMEVIAKFFTKHAWCVRPAVFWNIRWNTYWFKNEAAIHRPNEEYLRPIDEAEKIITETAVAIPRFKDNVEIDYVEWYARWNVQLSVDRKIWEEAEHLISGAQRGLIYFT